MSSSGKIITGDALDDVKVEGLVKDSASRTAGALSATYAPKDVETRMETRLRWDDLTRPYTIAHQSTPFPFPGHTDIGYRYAIAHGFTVLDLDAQTTADQVEVNLHDTTVDAFTTATGNISDYDSSLLGGLTVDIENWQAPGWAGVTPQKISGIGETITRYGTRLLYMIEPKTASVAQVQRVIDLCNRLGGKDQVMIQSANLASLAPAVSAGYRTNFISNAPDVNAVKAAGVGYVTAHVSVSNALIESWIAAGLKPMLYGVFRQYDHNRIKAIPGVEAIISDDPLYSSNGVGWRKTSTAFQRKIYTSGHLLAQGSRGTFQSGNDRLHFASGGNHWALLGQLRPASESITGKTITVNLTVDTTGTPSTAYTGIHFGAPDDQPFTGNASSSGYRPGYLLQFLNGSFQLFRCDGSTTLTQIGGVTYTGLTDGATLSATITVTDTDITCAIPALSKTFTSTDSTYRGPVIHIGQDAKGGTRASSFTSVSVA